MKNQKVTKYRSKVKLFFIFVFFITSTGIMFHSCTKDDSYLFNGNSSSIELRDENPFIYTPDDSVTETILGPKAPCNPYSVEIVTQAWNNLYPDYAVNEISPTDIYVKFTPKNEEDIYKLYKDPDLTIWDHPLDHQVIKMGNYYIQPDKGEDELPDLYSVIDKDYDLVFCDVSYEELEQLVEVPYNSFLSAETYRLCNLTHISIRETGDSVTQTDTNGEPYITSDPPPVDCNPQCDNYPCCFLEIVDCDGDMDPFEQQICDSYDPLCYPDDPDWPECLDQSDDGEDDNVNSCGCTTFKNKRKPAGCVKVQSPTGGVYVGVKNAKVIIKNHPYFDYNQNDIFGLMWTETTYTDDNGCWKINKECYGKIWVWVQFKNEMAYIRGHQDYNVLRLVIPVTDYVGEVSGPDFSDIQVRYNRWTTEGTQTQRYWCAATTINAVDDMHDMSNDEGINEPPHLDIYLGPGDGGAAPMSHYGGALEVASELGELGIVALSFMPDIYIGKDRFPWRYRQLNFHEMAHASHFTNVGIEWWNDNVNYEVGQMLSNPDQDPYGDGTDPGAGRCAVTESWAYHIGPLFAGRTDSDMDDLGLQNGFIPNGIHWDLFDAENADERAFVTDNVSGFTNAKIFDEMDQNTISIPQLRQRLWNDHSMDYGINATLADYNALFASYGY